MSHRVTIAGLSALEERPKVELGPPLLFVHGFFGIGLAFERMMTWFAHHGHRCVAPDLRGHGENPPLPGLGRVSVFDYADDVESVARTMDDPVIIGHSMGGIIAQILATRNCCRGIALLAPAPPRGIRLVSLPLAIAQIRYMPAILTLRAVHPGRADMLHLVLNAVPESERELVLDTLVPDSGRAALEMSVLGVPVDRSRVKVPVLVISGDRDRFIPLSRSRQTASHYAAPLRVAPGRGHMLIIEPGFEEICAWIEKWMPRERRTSESAA